jgi:hypothetical protein
MGTINLADLQVGMIVASEVQNGNGQLLLPAGTEINQKHLTILQAWGITEVNVQGVSRDEVVAMAAAQIDPAVLSAAEASNQELFRHADQTHPVIKELFTLCVMRKVRQSS